jgi:hypothetical protein
MEIFTKMRWRRVKWNPETCVWVSPLIWPFRDTIYYTGEFCREHPGAMWFVNNTPVFLYVWLWVRDLRRTAWNRCLHGLSFCLDFLQRFRS